MVLNYQSSSSGIQLGHAMVGKSQIFQHFIHLEVNLTFSTAWAVRKAVLWASDIMISTISLQEYYQKFVKIELKLLPLSGEKLHRRATNRLNEERLDIRVRGFWNSSQQAFFDIRVFDPSACRYLNKSRQQCHAMNKHEKKRLYNKQVLQVDHGTFTPLVFSVYSSMGRECNMFYSWLSDKRNLSKSITMNGLEQKFVLHF